MSEETITTTETPVVQMNGKPKLFTYRDLFTVRQCLHDAKSCCRRMKGDMVVAINKNLELLNTPIRMFDKKRQEGIDMFVSKDDKGKPVVIQPTPEEAKTGKKAAYKYEEGQEQACNEYMNSLLDDEAKMEKPFKLIPIASFAMAEIDTEKFKGVDYFIEMFVRE